MQRRTMVAALSAAGLPTFGLTGCATGASVQDGTATKPTEGLIAFKITSSLWAKLGYVKYEQSRSLRSFLSENLIASPQRFAVEPGDTYFVSPVVAGEYMWGRVELPMAAAELHGSNRFQVSPRTITYIGHLKLDLVQRRIVMSSSDNEADMRSHLALKFPKYIETMSFEKKIADFKIAA